MSNNWCLFEVCHC